MVLDFLHPLKEPMLGCSVFSPGQFKHVQHLKSLGKPVLHLSGGVLSACKGPGQLLSVLRWSLLPALQGPVFH